MGPPLGVVEMGLGAGTRRGFGGRCMALPCEEEGCGVTKFVAVKDGTWRGAGTSVLPGSLGHEAERSIGSDSSRPLGAYNGGFAGTWRV